ncbi:MAG: hypothetical protein KatS3mg002_0161 [Candidatus Woesearchaeota archaeon]|nr:MAG: hypothetical protein KatS3mg002_0161 [Candidatus Woesearchaeota archaeon]
MNKSMIKKDIELLNTLMPVEYYYEIFTTYVDLYNLNNNKPENVFNPSAYKGNLKKALYKASQDIKLLEYSEKAYILELFDIKIKSNIDKEKYDEAKYYSSMRNHFINNCI